MHKIFVYGTLLRGFGNWRWALKDRAEFIGERETLPAFTMINLGAYPGVISHGDEVIKGELFEVTDASVMRDLDRLEGHPNFYIRTSIKLSDGEDAEMYVLNRAWNYGDHANVVASGSWRQAKGKESLV